MLPLFKPMLAADCAAASIEKTLKSGCITTGPQVDLLAEKLSERWNRPQVIMTQSCTAALNLTLKLLKDELKLKNDHRIICSSLTCFAATSAILNNGFYPRWADVDESLTLDLNDVENKLSEESQIVMWTSWGGTAPNFREMDKISARYLNKYGKILYWVFDLAHAFDSFWEGMQLPERMSQTAFYCYSFGAIKQLTCGDGGALVCPSNFYSKAEEMVWYGISRKSGSNFRAWCDIKNVGSKWTMNDISASIGLANLPFVGKWIMHAVDNMNYYLENIKNEHITLLPASSLKGSSAWLFTLLIEDREDFIKCVGEHGISANGVHRPNHTLSCVEQYKVKLPYLDSIYNKYVCIPVGPWLKQRDVEYITNICNLYRK